MNSRQLKKLGVPEHCIEQALGVIHKATKSGTLRGMDIKQEFKNVLAAPDDFTEDAIFGDFAKALVGDGSTKSPLWTKSSTPDSCVS